MIFTRREERAIRCMNNWTLDGDQAQPSLVSLGLISNSKHIHHWLDSVQQAPPHWRCDVMRDCRRVMSKCPPYFYTEVCSTQLSGVAQLQPGLTHWVWQWRPAEHWRSSSLLTCGNLQHDSPHQHMTPIRGYQIGRVTTVWRYSSRGTHLPHKTIGINRINSLY